MLPEQELSSCNPLKLQTIITLDVFQWITASTPQAPNVVVKAYDPVYDTVDEGTEKVTT